MVSPIHAQVVSGASGPGVSQPQPKVGAKPVQLAIVIALGFAVKLLVPRPDNITIQAWNLLAIFLATIVALVLEPLPVGACAFLGLTATVLTKTLTFSQAMVASSNEVIWLIVVSFLFAKGFEKTGLGNRVANLFVAAFGKSTLGLAYSLAFAEALISPSMPSTSARSGGIFMPAIKSLSQAAGSTTETEESKKKLGRFLVQSQLQASPFSSAMYLTGAAQNLLCIKLCAELGAAMNNAWVTWFVAGVVPCMLMLLVTPYIIYKLEPPTLTDTPEAPQQARERLKEMGPMDKNQIIMTAVIVGAVLLWIFGEKIGVAAVTAAMLGLCALLITGVLNWRDVLSYTPAWDTFLWFSVLVGLSQQLNQLGVITAFSTKVGSFLQSTNLGWLPLMGILNTVYIVLHYFFASQTAHVGALYAAFLALLLQAGAPPVLSAFTLAQSSNLIGSMTHYASGQSAVYFGSGYIEVKDVFIQGFIMYTLSIVIWSTLGLAWWKVLGLF